MNFLRFIFSESCHKLLLILVREKGLKPNQNRWSRRNGGCFHNYRNNLFSGKPILQCGAAPFQFISVVLSFFGCAVYLVSGKATKAAMVSPKSFTQFL